MNFLKVTCGVSLMLMCSNLAIDKKLADFMAYTFNEPGEGYGYLEEPKINEFVLIHCNNYLVRCDNDPLHFGTTFYKIGRFTGMYEKHYQVTTFANDCYETHLLLKKELYKFPAQ